ncbi:MAG: helicase-related protein, partial [Gemmataceae bacterium]
MLTSAGRENLRQVETVILDEIHSLCPNKRGAFLSLLLERLEALRLGLPGQFLDRVCPLQRIGLSATQKPLDEVARFLGGLGQSPGENKMIRHRPVTILDAGSHKNRDVQIIWPQYESGPTKTPVESIWPAIHECTKALVNSHQSTIVFANNRRSAEKITAGINEDPTKPLAQAHHGSISLEKRLGIEESLKKGTLKAVIATSSLEMGIDMGPVNLVVQVESPGSVSSAIQRIGRAGHLVGQTSKGRILPKTDLDLAECAALMPMVIDGDVEPLVVPRSPLDILAQQIVSAVAMDCWPVRKLYDCFRKAYPYQHLTPEEFEETLDMISGRHLHMAQNQSGETGPEKKASTIRPRVLAALQPKIHHDRSLGILEALPGTKANAIAGGGAIPDAGNYLVIGPDGSRVGELDEEFVYERRAGDAFLLGTTVWRIASIEPDRVLVTPSPGSSAVLPFWRGEGPGRSLHVGRSLGIFLKHALEQIDGPNRLEWLERSHGLDRHG